MEYKIWHNFLTLPLCFFMHTIIYSTNINIFNCDALKIINNDITIIIPQKIPLYYCKIANIDSKTYRFEWMPIIKN